MNNQIQAIIALGSNLGKSEQIIKQAITSISQTKKIELIDASSLYLTSPEGFLNQPDFINAVCVIKTSLNPFELLNTLLAIEKKYHRIRSFKNGPRTLDLDLIDYNHETIHSESLILPHPRAIERAFVLIPLAEILPNFYLNHHHQNLNLELDFPHQSVKILK